MREVSVANWPRGKYGHSELSFSDGVKVINVQVRSSQLTAPPATTRCLFLQNMADETFVRAAHTTDVLICSLYEHVAESREATDIFIDAVKEEGETVRAAPVRVACNISAAGEPSNDRSVERAELGDH